MASCQLNTTGGKTYIVKPGDDLGPGRGVGLDDAVEVDVDALADGGGHEALAQANSHDGSVCKKKGDGKSGIWTNVPAKTSSADVFVRESRSSSHLTNGAHERAGKVNFFSLPAHLLVPPDAFARKDRPQQENSRPQSGSLQPRLRVTFDTFNTIEIVPFVTLGTH